MDPRWFDWANRLAAAAQNGLAYNTDPFNVERYESIRRIASEMMAAGSHHDDDELLDLLGSQAGHATPKVDVRGAVFREGKVLLIRERSDGRWALPGGWADVYDTPRQAVEREVWEESGYRTRATKLLGVYDRVVRGYPPMPFHSYKIVLQCEIVGGEPAHSIETYGVDFFAQDSLPPLSEGRTNREQIGLCFQHLCHPERPADFD